MPRYEYKVVPAPTRGIKAQGVRSAEAKFSFAIEALMNAMAGQGWEYQRAETLPSVERSGLTGSTTEWRNVLVFRRISETDATLFSPELLPAPRPEDLPAPADAPYETDEVDFQNVAGTGSPDPAEGSAPRSDGRIGASLSILARARNAARKASAAQSSGAQSSGTQSSGTQPSGPKPQSPPGNGPLT